MRNLIAFLIKNSYWFFFIILEVICFFLIFQYNSYQRSIYFNSSNEIIGRVYSISGNVSSFFNLRKNNEELLFENAVLQQRVLSLENQLQTFITDTTKTTEAFSPDLTHNQNYGYIVARVISNSVSQVENYIIINKGANDGIKPEMGVVSHKGIVGFIRNVSANYAVVQSALNPKTQLNCKVKRTNTPTTLIWDSNDYKYATLKDFPRYEKFNEGDTIITSGISKFFPEGYVVGRIKSSEGQRDDNFYSLQIELATDFASLSNVLIIDNYKQIEVTNLKEEVKHE